MAVLLAIGISCWGFVLVFVVIGIGFYLSGYMGGYFYIGFITVFD
jgi:hypothetical protein